jgi:hypothetical protein
MRVVEIRVCADCYVAIGAGDYSSFDYHYGDAAEERMREVQQAIAKLPGDAVANCQDEGHFSWMPCQCCECNLGGDRFEVALLGDDDDR